MSAVLANESEAAKNACSTQTAYGIGGYTLSAKRFLDLQEIYFGLRDALLKVVSAIREKEQPRSINIRTFSNDMTSIISRDDEYVLVIGWLYAINYILADVLNKAIYWLNKAIYFC